MTNQSATHTAIGFAIPLLPGKTEQDREAMRSCWEGERRHDYEASRRRHGIEREEVWIQPTPDGDMAVVRIQAADVEAAMGGLISSRDPFDVWFREHLLAVHGIDLAAGMTPSEQVLSFQA